MIKKYRAIGLLLSIVFFCCGVAGCSEKPKDAGTVEIVADLYAEGSSDYKILLSSEYTPAEQYAAEELADIFRNCTGFTLPVVYDSDALPEHFISIGNTNAFRGSWISMDADLGNGGFLLKTVGDDLYIQSTTEAGKIYGVFEFCERSLGYRYYAADEILYPQHENVGLVNFDVTCIPSFDGRNVFSRDTVYDYQNAVHLRVSNMVSNWPEEYGEASMWSSLTDTSNVHQLLNVREYYNDHPAWFYLDSYAKANASSFENMSDADFYSTYGNKHTQLCYTQGLYDDSEGGMFDTYMNNLIEYMVNEPDRQFFMLGMADNSLLCDCARCQTDTALYKNSGVMLRFVNKVARAVKDWLANESGTPDRKIYLVAFAYLTVMEPPVKYVNREPAPIDDSVIAEDNVCIRIAPLVDANFYWPINDAENNTYMYNNILGWELITSNFTIWDYRLYFNCLVAPYPYWNTLKSNLLIYKEMNVLDVYHQGYSETAVPFGKLDDYVRARLLFNLEEDVGALIDDFVTQYYKEAAPYISEYIRLLQMHYENYIVPQGYSGSVYTNIIDKKFWPIGVLLQIQNLFDEAYASIENLPEDQRSELKDRIDRESRFYRYSLIELYNDYYTKAELRAMIAGWETANTVDPLTEYCVRVSMDSKLSEWKMLVA